MAGCQGKYVPPLGHDGPGTPQGLRGADHIYGMYNVLFHVILFAYLLASLFFWLSMGLRQRWLFHLAHGLLGGGFGLQTLILATAYHLLGIDPATELSDRQGRPMSLVPDGKVLTELLA